jgi:hypothetical protein
MGNTKGRLTSWLESSTPAVATSVSIVAAFSTYFCMYAFRKPFAAASFAGVAFLGTAVNLKTAYVISQTIGYALSKFAGIKVCSEATRARRPWLLIGLVGFAELMLLLFGLLPPNARVVAILLNGLPLGMVWGLVVQYLEGRRSSELLLAGLSCSFIVASGTVKDVGLYLMNGFGVSEAWMPFATGLLFLPAFLLSVWVLDQTPPPSAEDVRERVRRAPMDSSQRWALLRGYAAGLIPLLLAYFFLTAYRDFRDNFSVEIRDALGYHSQAATFTRTEFLVAFGVMGALALLNIVRDNRRGLAATYAVIGGGLALMGGATLLLGAHLISGFWWFTLVGLGSYLAYVPYGSVLFDRLIAAKGIVATAVFLIYVADAIGYAGSLGVQLYKDLAFHNQSHLAFFIRFTLILSGSGMVLVLLSALSLIRRPKAPVLQSPTPSGGVAAVGVAE